MIGKGVVSRGEKSRAATRVLVALFWERKERKEERTRERREERTLTSLYYQNILLLPGSPTDQRNPGVRRLHMWGG